MSSARCFLARVYQRWLSNYRDAREAAPYFHSIVSSYMVAGRAWQQQGHFMILRILWSSLSGSRSFGYSVAARMVVILVIAFPSLRSLLLEGDMLSTVDAFVDKSDNVSLALSPWTFCGFDVCGSRGFCDTRAASSSPGEVAG